MCLQRNRTRRSDPLCLLRPKSLLQSPNNGGDVDAQDLTGRDCTNPHRSVPNDASAREAFAVEWTVAWGWLSRRILALEEAGWIRLGSHGVATSILGER